MDKQNLQTNLMLLCDYAMIAKDGKISLLGVFEELRNNNPPIVLNRGFLVATVNGVPNTTHKISIRAEHGSKKENILPPLEMNITMGPNGKNNLLIELQGVQFPQPGSYSFRIYSDSKVIGATELKVVRVEEKTQEIN